MILPFLHYTQESGTPPEPAPSAHPNLSSRFPEPSGSGFSLLPSADPISPSMRNSGLLLLGGCCIIGPNPFILEVRKPSQRRARTSPGCTASPCWCWYWNSFPLNSYRPFLWGRFSPGFPHRTEPHLSLLCCWRPGLSSCSVTVFPENQSFLPVQGWTWGHRRVSPGPCPHMSSLSNGSC